MLSSPARHAFTASWTVLCCTVSCAEGVTRPSRCCQLVCCLERLSIFWQTGPTSSAAAAALASASAVAGAGSEMTQLLLPVTRAAESDLRVDALPVTNVGLLEGLVEQTRAETADLAAQQLCIAEGR